MGTIKAEVIIIEKIGTNKETTECWGSLTKICREHPSFSYKEIYRLKFPFEHNGYKFKKIPYNSKLIIK